MLSLGAVQTPQRDSPLFKPALLFVKEKVHQHDVEFDVVGQDTKGSGFIGNVWLGKQALHCMLLEEGFAKIYRGADKDSEMIIAEDVAKRAKKNLWHDYDEAAEEAKRKERRAEESERRRPKQEYIDVVVTEIIDGTTFYVQIVGPEAEKLEELMKSLATEESTEAYKPRRDEVVKAQFSDDAWYRAKVIKVAGEDEYQVQYVDYGNSEIVPSSRIRKLPNEFNPTLKESKALPFQAVKAVLAYLKTPPVEEEYGREAAEFLKELVWGKTMMANIERRDPEVLHLSLGDRESQVHVNAALLRAGLARVERVRGEQYREMLDKLREEESKARSTHSGIWEYGDPGSDEDEDDRPKGKRRN
jgi:staphylococcal nuclease domain-containing protein 1